MRKTKNEYYQYLREHIKIVDVCRFLDIQLRPSGDDYICQCFSHSDAHPSMHIYTDSNRYHCYQCGDNGDIFQLVKGKLKCGFKESLSWLEGHFPEVLSEKPVMISGNNSGYSNGFELAWSCYKEMTPTEKDKLKEFAKKRQCRLEDLIDSEVVFAESRKLQRKFGTEAEYIEERNLLQEGALLQKVPRGEKDISFERYDDFFKTDRVIIALRDDKKQLIGFAGRSISEGDKPKYLFTRNLNKKEGLYGFCRIRERARSRTEKEREDLYLVEGIFDVLRLESMGKSAAAVLGSHLLQNQSRIVADYIMQAGHSVTIHICMDSDAAGMKGACRTIRNLWKNSILRRTEIKVDILEGAKDPDEFYQQAVTSGKGRIFTYSAMEFLFRYYLREGDEPLTEVEVAKAYREKSTEEKIRLLHAIETMMSKEEWNQLFQWRQLFEEKQNPENVPESENRAKEELEKPENFSWEYIRRYVFEVGDVQEYTNEKEKDYLFHMHTALQIARTSYQRENLLLDEDTWDRIAAGADAFFPYLYDLLSKKDSFKEIPMIEVMIPKKKGEQRRKSFYIHEETVLQQYVLNELLSRGNHVQYEKFIPAVRYAQDLEGGKTYVTGYGTQEEVVSFAYQIDMSAVNGESEIKHGMFRPFYDCWKDYIQYVQNGIERLEGETVYRVKLDIRGFYDNIRKNVVRNALYPPIRQALLKDDSKFRCFRKEQDDEDDCAERLVDWILNELFKEACYSAETGEAYIRENSDCGIPQGPNLSAYVANVLLFTLDQKISQMVKEINKECDSEHIAARYCRYVDDMIIIASESNNLLKIKNAISAILYEMGLELSHKTDEEDGVTKEEAIDWTVDARGGLGVPVGYDMADDTLESVMDSCNEYDVVDRREALKLIRSTLQPLLGGDITEEELRNGSDGQQLLEIIFRTDEIRANDIIRFSEFLIYCASEKTGGLFEEYRTLWKNGMEMCPDESVLWTEGIDIFVFLEGCLKILQRKRKIEKENIYSVWHTAANKIQRGFAGDESFLRIMRSEAAEKELLKKNAWILYLKYLQICSLLGKTANLSGNVENIPDNEYSERWIWSLPDKKLWNRSKKASILQTFQFVLMAYQNFDTKEQIEEVNSQISNYRGELLNRSERNLLTECMGIWIKKERAVQYSKETVRIALRVLLNSLRCEIRAEIIGEIPAFADYLFEDSEKQQILPVYPGVDYPGIMAYGSDSGELTAERFDFQKADVITGNEKIWNNDDKKKMPDSDLTYYTAELKGNKKRYVSLEEYFEKQIAGQNGFARQESTIEEIMEKTIEVYPVLVEKIQEVYRRNPEERMLLSKKNVILCIDEAADPDKKISAELGMSYLVSARKISGAVAVEKDSKYILQQVNESGAPYWIAGRLLADTFQLEQINLRMDSDSREFIESAEMLRYSFRRLQGHYLNYGGLGKKGKHSFEKTMHRTIENMKSFLRQSDLRKLYLESAKIENGFIAFRLGREEYSFEDSSLEVAVWAKNSLRNSYREIVRIVEGFPGFDNTRYDIVRRVPEWYCYLADRLRQIIGGDTTGFMPAAMLSAGLYSDAVLMNLRMQTLERIRALSKEERRRFSEQADVPYAELGLEDDCVLLTGRSKERKWNRLWKNLLNLKTDMNIRSVTHIGWIVMLSKLYEADKTVGFIVKGNAAEKNRCTELLKNLVQMVNVSNSVEDNNGNFPYEGLGEFLDIWNPEAVQKMIAIMNELDDISGIEVKKQKSDKYNQKVREADVIIDCEEDHLTENKYFLTFSKIGDGIFELERDLKDPEKFVYSISKKGKKKLGISTIIGDFGKLLQQWEGTPEKDEKKTDADEERNGSARDEQRAESENPEEGNLKPQEESKEVGSKEVESKGLEAEEWKSGICLEQKKLWKKRTDRFANYDRIALFQFDIDSTYYPPFTETCSGEDADKASGNLKASCAEFRRRKILEQILEACSLFNVDILLLPEYSVRPETVEWMAEQIDNNGYDFAVWAGTFRIPAGHRFETERYWKSTKDLNSSEYYHAAVLPVIMPERKLGKDAVTILTHKTKKYPSVALHEEINPIPAEKENFMPVIRKSYKDRYKNNMLFGNAWDDVTEVICAEMFALSGICNYPSFLMESYKAYIKYQTAGNPETKDEYEKEMLEDIRTYGQYTSIYQQKNRHGRTPIVLVPACTTRATDYYIWGQGQYLAAGIKTVLCNSAGKVARGGSCFIGPESWDDRRIEHDENLLANTVYHGLKPGMYRQSSRTPDRGALGPLEQALLIYDVNPQYEKSKPTAESTLDAFSIVAHSPVIETRREEGKCGKCKNPYICKARKGEKESEVYLLAKELIDLFKKTSQRSNTIEIKLTEEEKMKAIAEKLEKLGKFCNSDWMCRRADFFREYSVLRPEKWVAPSVLDWIYIEIDYGEFHESEEDYWIQVME